LYVNKTICVSWAPVSLAFKLSGQEVNDLIIKGKAKPLKYFAKGHLKKDMLFLKALKQKKQSTGKNIL
jgi:hypothetical protein